MNRIINFEHVSTCPGDFCTGVDAETGERITLQVKSFALWALFVVWFDWLIPTWWRGNVVQWAIQRGIVFNSDE